MAEDGNRDWGHHKSPFFKLPPEIRNKIYHETFAGSERNLVIDPPLPVKVVPITGRRSIFTTDKSTHHFLLTCFQVYCEALAICWSLTVICNVPFSRGYFLNRIPAIARPYIQHLRNVNLRNRHPNKWLQGDAIPRHLSPAMSLDLFTNLKSCTFTELGHGYAPGLIAEFTARHPNVHHLVRQVNKVRHSAKARSYVHTQRYWPIKLLRYKYRNLTSGSSLTWYQPESGQLLLSPEAAFQMVWGPALNEIKATEIRLQYKDLDYYEPWESDDD